MLPECLMNVCHRKSYKWKTLSLWSEEAIQGRTQSTRLRFQHTNRVVGTDCTGLNKVARPHKKGCWWIRSKKNPSRNVGIRKPAPSHHQQSFLPHISLVLSATGSLELRLVSSAILDHTNNNTSRIWLGLVIVSNDRRTNTLHTTFVLYNGGLYLIFSYLYCLCSLLFCERLFIFIDFNLYTIFFNCNSIFSYLYPISNHFIP